MSTYIKVYRGNQIGGCVTEIRTEKTKLIIDFGENLPGNESTEELQLEGLTYGQADVAAVFFTHYHGDHMGWLKEILPSIPLYMGTATRRVLQTISDTIRNENLSALLKDDSHIKEFEQGLTYQIGDIKVTPYSVDHSAYDAHMFFVETPNKVILHTGDYRLHGYRGSKMIEVIEKLVKKNGKRKVDVLITEGTMMSRGSEKYYTEADMQKEMVGIITEIFFYSNYMWDLVRDNGEFEISKTENQKEEKEAGLRGYFIFIKCGPSLCFDFCGN